MAGANLSEEGTDEESMAAGNGAITVEVALFDHMHKQVRAAV
jgi:hypothetical protein